MLTMYFIYKVFENPIIDFVVIPLALATIAFICVAVYAMATGHRPSKRGLENGILALGRQAEKKQREKLEYDRYYREHKPYPWSTWRD